MTKTPRTPEDEKKLAILGSYVRSWRERKGFTQEELAPAAGFTRSYITDIECGKRNISFLNLLKIIDALNITEKDLASLLSEALEEKA